MRRVNLALLACLQLCRALQPSFSIHEDLLAHPQFEVVFSESYILEKDAQLLLDHIRRGASTTHPPDATSSQTDVATPAHESVAVDGTQYAALPSPASQPYGGADDGDGSEQVSETFEVMNVPPSRYLCSIPILAPPPAPNQTATELAKAEEAREMSRASSRGMELLNSMNGECMYYVSGWWSYSFCYGREIIQFHALTTKTGQPIKDPHSQEYILGRMQPDEDSPAGRKAQQQQQQQQRNQKSDLDVQKPLEGKAGETKDVHNTELQVKGDQRYMVQRLGAGTVCDLTSRERTIEIQYHCNPGGTSDRISWIKEVTTCAYLMEVRTPRLCEETAFLPPKPTRAHPISCRLIVSSDEDAVSWRQEKTIEAHDAMQPAVKNLQDQKRRGQVASENVAYQDGPSLVVGGVAIGARQALGHGEDGQLVVKLEPPAGFTGPRPTGGTVVEVIAKAASAKEGGHIEMLANEDLQRLDLNPEVIEELCHKLHKIAGGAAWKLEAVEVPGQKQLEMRASLDVDSHDDAAKPGDAGNKGGTAAAAGTAGDDAKETSGNRQAARGEGGGQEAGSEETFKKDEL